MLLPTAIEQSYELNLEFLNILVNLENFRGLVLSLVNVFPNEGLKILYIGNRRVSPLFHRGIQYRGGVLCSFDLW